MTFITRNCSTSYAEMMDMDVDDINELFISLINLMNEEVRRQKEAYEKSRSSHG